jgi:hypothetical protein
MARENDPGLTGRVAWPGVGGIDHDPAHGQEPRRKSRAAGQVAIKSGAN